MDMSRKIDIQTRLKRAVDLHRIGEVIAANSIYFEILEMDPENAEALHLSGVAAHQFGDIDVAMERIKKAIVLDNSFSVYHNNLGNVFLEAGRTGEAKRHYQNALKLNSGYSDAYVGLGNVFFQTGKWRKAIGQYLTAARLAPESDRIYYNLGLAFQKIHKMDRAIGSFQQTLRINPTYTDAYINLGHVFKRKRSYNNALVQYKKALQLEPGNATIFVAMAKVYRKLGEYHKAVASIRQILKKTPESAGAWNDLGALYMNLNRQQDAKDCFKRSIALNPEDAVTHNNFGMLHWSLNNLDEAIVWYRKSVAIDPAYADAFYNLGNVYGRKKEISHAIACYRKAIELKPEDIKAHSYLVHQLQHGCLWNELEPAVGRLCQLAGPLLHDEINAGFPPFLALTISNDPRYNLAISKSWCNYYFGMIQPIHLPNSGPFHGVATCPGNRSIRIGYLSGDFSNHATAHLMRSLFKTHDRSRFRIYAYSYGVDDESSYRKDIISGCDRFEDIRHLNHEEAARKIAADKIDILVDLKGHTNGNQMEICAYRPAPIQAAYLGFPGTCGADFIDYLIGDAIVTPVAQKEFFTENIVCLPNCYQVNDIEQEISAKPVSRSSMGLFDNSFVFCSFNEPYKIESRLFDLWMDLLHLVPNSFFWLLETSTVQVQNLRQEAKKRGIAENRLVFAPKIEKKHHLARLKLADLCLDTVTVNGHTTTSDALWAGVPVITLIGNHFASRVSASLLRAVGLPECIAESLSAYKELALKLASEPLQLKNLKARLEENRLHLPLFDTGQFVKNLEIAFTFMWKRHLSGEPPSLIDLTKKDYDCRDLGLGKRKDNNFGVRR